MNALVIGIAIIASILLITAGIGARLEKERNDIKNAFRSEIKKRKEAENE